jgi:hypothetical protein
MGVQQERRPASHELGVAGGTSSSTEQIEYTPAVQSFCKVPPLREGGLTVQPRLCYIYYVGHDRHAAPERYAWGPLLFFAT